MPTARRSRTIAASAQELWELICDPHHLPRWWPRVTRVEDVQGDAFTEVMKTKRGKTVRADFRIACRDQDARVLVWEQQVAGTPFEQVLSSAETELRLAPIAAEESGGATDVTIELRQMLVSRAPRALRFAPQPRIGGLLVRYCVYAPLLALVLAKLAGASDLTAANVGLAAAIVLLTVHGWLAGRATRLRSWQLLVATSIAATLGLLMIALKDLVLIRLH